MDLPQLDRIEAKIDRLLSGPDEPIIGAQDAMRLMGAKSYGAFYRMLRIYQVHAITKGKYRRIEITNAIGRRAIAAGKTS